MSLREKILAKQDIQEQIVEVSEWEVSILVRGLTGRQRAKLLTEAVDEKGKPDLQKIYPELVILSSYDPETKEKVFQPTDRDAVVEKSGAALEKIAQVAMKISGLSPETAREAEKNLKETPSEDSTLS
jgi:hypothetical protein